MKKQRRTTLLRLIFSHFSRLTQVNEVQNRNQILSCIRERIFCLSAKNKTPTLLHRGIIGAANQNRTDDLILTKDVLYQLSHSSVSQIDEHYYIRKLVVCQVFFELFLKTVNISARTVGFVMAGSELRCDD